MRSSFSKMVHLFLYVNAKFRHKEQVDAVEQMKGSDCPTMVKTILLCHSMGGIIAADSLFAMASDNDPLHPSILGIIAYDTPYLGLNPPVYHRTISTRVQGIMSAINTAREWVPTGLFTSNSKALTVANQPKKTWGWGSKLAAVSAGVAAVGALGYFAKDPVVNHLQFVSVLYKADDLSKRMTRLADLEVGFVVFYTVVTQHEEGDEERTFCLLPREREQGIWMRQENGVAKDEVEAHCTMFLEAYNDHYQDMCKQSLAIIKEWIVRAEKVME